MRKFTTTKGVELRVPEKGEKHPGAGRPKGGKNKISLGLREAFVAALESVGADGKGQDGLKGYLVKVAMTRPDLIMPILGKIVLLEMKAEAKAEKKRARSERKAAPGAPRHETLEELRDKFAAKLAEIDRIIASKNPAKPDAETRH